MLNRLDSLMCEHQTAYGPEIGRELDMLQYFGGVSASDNEQYDLGVENVINLRAWDSSGNEIPAEYDSETGITSFSEEPVKITYDYITGFEDVNMDVTIFAGFDESGNIVAPGRSQYQSGSGGNNLGASDGGCISVSILPLFMAMLILTVLVRWRKR